MNQRIFQLIKRLLIVIASILLLSVIVFTMSRLAPGDPLIAYYGEQAEKLSVEERKWAMERLGLNDSLPQQYGRWLKQAAQGELGLSYKYKQPVMQVISARMGNSALLVGSSFVLLCVLSLLLGCICACYEDSLIDKLLRRSGIVFSCLPEFWFSLLLILLFSVLLPLFPSSGAHCIGRADSIADRLHHLVLPLAAVLISHAWYYAYLVRNKLCEEVRAEYVLLAKAKGLSRLRILLCHCLPNVLPGYISLMVLALPHILGGTYVVEAVFSYPGLGALIYESARYHDYNLLMVLSLFTGAVVIAANMLAQALNERIDPRTAGRNTEVSYYD